MDISQTLLLVNLVSLLVSLTVTLKRFFKPKLLVFITTLTVLGAVAIPLVESQDSAAFMLTSIPGIFTTCILWDSRTFLIDNFSLYKFLLFRPFYSLLPVSGFLILFGVVPLHIAVSLPVIAAEIVVGSIVPEITYSVSKRYKLMIPPTAAQNRYRSISTYSSTLPTPSGAYQQIRIQ